MRNCFRNAFAFFALISFVVSAPSCRRPPSTGPLSVKISVNSWIGWAPMYLAQEKGIFQRNGVTVELVRIEDTGARKSTMIAGHVDGYATSVDNFQLDSSGGVPGRIVMLFDESFGADGIVAKKSIRSVADLKGKQIAFQAGLPSHFFLLQVLRDAGVSPADIKPVDMDADKAGAAFTSGKLDAAVTWEPWLTKSSEMADGHILISTREKPGTIVDALAFREDVLTSKRGAVAAVVKSWFEALEYWNQHKEEADAIMSKAYNLSIEDFNSQVKGVRFLGQADNVRFFGTASAPGPVYQSFDTAGIFWKENKIISGNPTSSKDRIDSSFVIPH